MQVQVKALHVNRGDLLYLLVSAVLSAVVWWTTGWLGTAIAILASPLKVWWVGIASTPSAPANRREALLIVLLGLALCGIVYLFVRLRNTELLNKAQSLIR
jgi:hypothetical protein